MRLRILFLVLSFSVCARLAEAQELRVEDVPNPRSTHAGWVTDVDDVLGATAETIERRYEKLKRDTGAEIALVILPTIGDASPRAFATKLFQHWGIGGAGVDDGVLVLHVLDQRRVEIETGYGAEAALADAKCNWLLQEVALPAFRAGDLADGHASLSRGLDYGMRAPEASHGELLDAANGPGQRSGGETSHARVRAYGGGRQPEYPWHPRIVTLLLLAAVVGYRLHTHHRYYRYHARYRSSPKAWLFSTLLGVPFVMADWDGHWPWPGIVILGLTSLFTGFAALRQRAQAQFRYRGFRCIECGAATRLLDEAKAKAALTSGARAEEQLGAVEYDVWGCVCGKTLICELPGSQNLALCRKCSFRTDRLDATTELKAATYEASGLAQQHFVCAHCAATRVKEVAIPQRTRSTSRSSGSSSSGSSSSGSSSSFGGGSSGGGGAGGSY